MMDTREHPDQVRSNRWIVAARWMISFVGFPLGGLAAMLTVGRVDSLTAALAGGLITGAVLGTAQVLGLGRLMPNPAGWIAATAGGLAVGLGIGATAVGFATDLPSLMIEGALSGLAVGAAQGVVLRRRRPRFALVWPLYLAVCWALAWALITVAGVQVDNQFTVFGAIGAVSVTAATLVLPLTLVRTSVRSAS
ncbi:hypothetical protein [Nakamurella sp.]|uniref:hypothetical protein n=1 Tax=Nakamurella sp. TaxID=1869182 RepID=UPI0037852D05